MSLNPPITDWQSKHVWIIGASTGIGRAVAQALHVRGAHVTVSARNAAALHDFVAQHPGSTAVPLDVSDRAAVAQAAGTVQSRHAQDLVCFCAGHYKPMRADAMDLDELLRHQQVNVVGALHVVAAVVPAMLEAARQGQTPHLSLVASVAGLRG